MTWEEKAGAIATVARSQDLGLIQDNSWEWETLREKKNKDESTGHKLVAKEVWETPQPAKRGKAGLLIVKVGIVKILSLFRFSEKVGNLSQQAGLPNNVYFAF